MSAEDKGLKGQLLVDESVVMTQGGSVSEYTSLEAEESHAR